jgi:hypothetical protein
MSLTRFAISGCEAEMIPITPTARADTARSRSAVRLRSVTYAGYNVLVTSDPLHIPLPRWVTGVLAAVVIFLVPWSLYLTFTLPSRDVTLHYDLTWVGFDIALAASFAATAWAALRGSKWLVAFAAITGTMLCCDAWFDIVTSQAGFNLAEAITEAAVAELPLAALCFFIVYDAERFLAVTHTRFRREAATRGRASS